MKVLIAGGAGFIGSYLCEHYCGEGAEVICLDNLITGSRENIVSLLNRKNFTFLETNVSQPFPKLPKEINFIFNLASPASPVDYYRYPLETLRVGSAGTENLLELARKEDAFFVLASTSEIYGDPKVHPQKEDYWGNVNPNGPRSVYDESKRYAEAVTAAYRRKYGLKIAISRIFNTYGPRLRPADGRVVSNFISQALAGTPVTVYGDGSQTRSLCYVSDLVTGLARLAGKANAVDNVVVNLGNAREITILELAKTVIFLCRSRSEIVFQPLPEDDPARRCPDISQAKAVLDWEPMVSLEEGLRKTISWFEGGK
ncbi:MAG: SDR family oxidoreductase [Candidatus Omnitrophica bacterium]|nr:SDR family oxidoreductase [Candidatus Omnitrophota bacterium]